MAASAQSGTPTLLLRAGHDVVPAAQTAAVAAAVEASNRAQRIGDLPDALNPGIIDPAKATALLEALHKMPADALAAIGNKALYLNSPGLQIGATAPTTPASFARPFRLEVVEVQGETVLARATVVVDCDVARRNVGEARARLADAEQRVKALEAKGGGDRVALIALSDARAQRFAIAKTWRQNASAVMQCGGDGAAAQADLTAAEQAVKTTIVAPRTGMP